MEQISGLNAPRIADDRQFQNDRASLKILIISDTHAAATSARGAAETAGGQIIAEINVADAAHRLENQISIDAVMIECARSPSTTINPLLDQIGKLAGKRRPATLVATSIDEIDGYTDRMADDTITFLCNPNLADRVVALQLAMAISTGVLRDGATDIESMRLRRIADEVGRIAKALANLSEPERPHEFGHAGVMDMAVGFRAEPDHRMADTGPSANELRSTIRARRVRDQFFESDLFADPAWDMLLDLLAARLESVQVAVSSLCIAAAVPPTTALRWIKRMTDEGIFERVADPDDGSRIFIRLSDHASDAMVKYWAAARRVTSAIV